MTAAHPVLCLAIDDRRRMIDKVVGDLTARVNRHHGGDSPRLLVAVVGSVKVLPVNSGIRVTEVERIDNRQVLAPGDQVTIAGEFAMEL